MEQKKHVFTLPEKKKFLEILKSYSKIVENKNTHTSALKAKNIAWQRITYEFNTSQETDTRRTPQQLRRLWMNLKQRQRDAIARTLHPLCRRGPMDSILGTNMLHIAHPLMTGLDSSMDSDVILETLTNDDQVQSETSLYPSEESQDVSNQEPLFSTVKIEPMSPINIIPVVTMETTPADNQIPTVTPNNKAHITQQHDYLNQDSKSRVQSNLELEDLEIQLLKEKVRAQREENKNKEARAAAVHNLEYLILKENLREAKAKADLAELNLRRQNYSDD